MRKWFVLFLLTWTWSACRKDTGLPPSGSDSPYFSVVYNAGTLLEQKVVAGVADAYLFTNYRTGGDGVVTCSGTFSAVQCLSDTCPDRLRFEFRNAQIGSVVLPDSAFRLGSHAFSNIDPAPETVVYRTTFEVDSAQDYTNFTWHFNNQFSATGSSITVDFPEASSSVLVNLQSDHTPEGVSSVVQRRVALPSSGEIFPSADIAITSQPGSIYLVEALLSGHYNSLSWSTGIVQPVFEADLLDSTYTLTLEDSSGTNTFARLSKLPSFPPFSLHTVNFSTTSKTLYIPSPDSLQLGTVAIQWTDQNHRIWRSDRGTQAGSQFQVLESRVYELNELGQQTWQMQVAFTCRLYDEQGESMPFSGSGRIAVAYP